DRFGSTNSAYYFVVNSIIDFGMSNDFAVTTLETKTVSLWFQSTTGQYPFLNKYQNSVVSNSNFFIGNDAPAFTMSDGIIVAANGNGSLFHPFQAGNWFHVVVIYSGPTGTVELYINGILVETTTLVFNSSASTNPLIIQGTKMSPDYEDADGKIDDIGFWNRALNECEIQDLYNAQLNSTVYTVTQVGAQLTADQTGATYQWLDCNNNDAVINLATSQSYTPTTGGSYSVEVNLNGCKDTSDCKIVSLAGLNELSKGNVKLSKIVDLMGRETPFKPNTVLIYVYDDGTTERVFKLEE
ncbi:LamG domain-containing protein, partial [Crocinitomicaceae bacterium]|nr:LamG domain-containing protein [Crocinitomicaceae bacterium]